jgi:hypothetical protein
MAKPNNKSKTTQTAAVETPPSAPVTTTTSAPVTDAPAPYRENPRTNEKIDEWIKRNPDQFKFFDQMPHERAVRKLILNEIDRYERQQKARSYRQQEQHGGESAPRHDRSQSNGNGMRTR